MPSPVLHPAIDVAVVLRKQPVEGAMRRWQSARWSLDEVVCAEPEFGQVPRLLHRQGERERWLFPGFTVALFPDDAEGYYLNLSSPTPGWFVMWRMEEEPGLAEDCMPIPQIVTLSYHDAGRWLDAQETVEQVAAPADVVAWLGEFVAQHHQPDPKRRKRPESFRALTDRFGNPASVSTEKIRGGTHGG